jgi:uncharacterized protein DUF4397
MRLALLRRGLAASAVLAAAAGLSLAAASPAAAADASKVSVVHGIPGQPVDVYVNGNKTLDNFAPATVAGPLDLAAGTYDVVLTKPGEPVTSPILENKALAVPAGQNLSLVAHLDGSGQPKLTAFVNDTSAIAAGMTRLSVRHTAAAPTVDVRAGGTPVFTGLSNPNEAKADLAAGTVNADVVLAGTTTVAIGPASLDLKAGTSTIVYAIGSADQKTLAVVAQSITGLADSPAGMPAGSGGLARTGVSGVWYLIVIAGAALLLGGAALGVTLRPAVARRR